MMKKLVEVIVVLLVACSMAAADDLNSPDWRWEDNTTYQLWEFSTSDLVPLPDAVGNPSYMPQLQLDSCLWLDVYKDHEGVFTLSGQIDVHIPNFDEPNPTKLIRIQLTWIPSTVDSPYLPNEPLVAVTPYMSMSSYREDTDLGNGWWLSVFDITISPNPPEEWIAIKGEILVDQLVIDTMCVPEPATICLLGLGGLALLRKRRI